MPHVHVHTHNANFGTVWSILVSALGREVQRWRFTRLAVCAFGGLRGCRFGWFVVWAVGGLQLVVCGLRLAVGSLRG